MASAVKQEAEQFEILEHRMTRITVVAEGASMGSRPDFEATMPASTPQDIGRTDSDRRSRGA